jgi:hypothetical protein
LRWLKAIPPATRDSPHGVFLNCRSPARLAGAISGLLGQIVDATAILAIVVLNIVIDFYQELNAEKSNAALPRFPQRNNFSRLPKAWNGRGYWNIGGLCLRLEIGWMFGFPHARTTTSRGVEDRYRLGPPAREMLAGGGLIRFRDSR